MGKLKEHVYREKENSILGTHPVKKLDK